MERNSKHMKFPADKLLEINKELPDLKLIKHQNQRNCTTIQRENSAQSLEHQYGGAQPLKASKHT